MFPKSLYNIRQDHLRLLAQLEESSGELTPELEQQLALTEDELQDKAISYACIVKEFEVAEEAINKEFIRLKKLLDAAQKRKELFKMRLAEGLKQFGVDKIETPTLKISFRKSTSVEVLSEWALPNEYKKMKWEVSKSRVKAALTKGIDVPGAQLKENHNIQIK